MTYMKALQAVKGALHQFLITHYGKGGKPANAAVALVAGDLSITDPHALDRASRKPAKFKVVQRALGPVLQQAKATMFAELARTYMSHEQWARASKHLSATEDTAVNEGGVLANLLDLLATGEDKPESLARATWEMANVSFSDILTQVAGVDLGRRRNLRSGLSSHNQQALPSAQAMTRAMQGEMLAVGASLLGTTVPWSGAGSLQAIVAAIQETDGFGVQPQALLYDEEQIRVLPLGGLHLLLCAAFGCKAQVYELSAAIADYAQHMSSVATITELSYALVWPATTACVPHGLMIAERRLPVAGQKKPRFTGGYVPLCPATPIGYRVGTIERVTQGALGRMLEGLEARYTQYTGLEATYEEGKPDQRKVSYPPEVTWTGYSALGIPATIRRQLRYLYWDVTPMEGALSTRAYAEVLWGKEEEQDDE